MQDTVTPTFAEAVRDHLTLDEAPVEAEALPAFVTDPIVIRFDAIEGFALMVALEQRLARLVRHQRHTEALRQRLGRERGPDDDFADQSIEIIHRAIRRVDAAFGYEAPVGGIEQFQAEDR